MHFKFHENSKPTHTHASHFENDFIKVRMTKPTANFKASASE